MIQLKTETFTYQQKVLKIILRRHRHLNKKLMTQIVQCNLLASFCKPDYFNCPLLQKKVSLASQKFTVSVRTLLETLNFTFCCHLTKKFTRKKIIFQDGKESGRNSRRCKTTPTNFSRKMGSRVRSLFWSGICVYGGGKLVPL